MEQAPNTKIAPLVYEAAHYLYASKIKWIIAMERELDIGGVDGSNIHRLIKALRELSKQDESVAKKMFTT